MHFYSPILLLSLHECLRTVLQFLDRIHSDILQRTNSPWTKLCETPQVWFPTLMYTDSPWDAKHLPWRRHVGFSLWDLEVKHCSAWRHWGYFFALAPQPSQNISQSKTHASITYFCLHQQHQNFLRHVLRGWSTSHLITVLWCSEIL